MNQKKTIKRDIIHIKQDLCVGCGQCVTTCHQGALGLVNGKATLLSEDYCDGLGRCLPDCPTGALSVIQKEVEAPITPSNNETPTLAAGGCPGTMAGQRKAPESNSAIGAHSSENSLPSELTTWPLQLGLVSPNAPYLAGADLLIAADCTAFSYGEFHRDFIRGRVCLIGCPKLDNDHSEKIAAILGANSINSITVVRMEVPCCGGIVEAVKKALAKTGSVIPWSITTISLAGERLG